MPPSNNPRLVRTSRWFVLYSKSTWSITFRKLKLELEFKLRGFNFLGKLLGRQPAVAQNNATSKLTLRVVKGVPRLRFGL